MFSDGNLIVSLIFFGPPIATSVLYFIYDKNKSLPLRVFSSIHGVSLVAFAFISSLFLVPWNVIGAKNQTSILPYLALITLFSIIFSFKYFKGNKFLHLLQLINIFYFLVYIVLQSMFITGSYI